MINIIKARLLKGVAAKKIKQETFSGGYESCGNELKKTIIKKFGRSLHIRQVDTGSCGACVSEIIACSNPVYDIQRFGINFVASPRHADCLLVTGPVSRNMTMALKSTYEAMPEPKFVITLGDCSLDGGLFKESYYIPGPVKSIVPVALHIPGCPPEPETIIKSLLAFLTVSSRPVLKNNFF